MKVFMMILSLLVTFSAQAAPIINENMATSELITVYPDSVDPNLYYYAPNQMEVCRDADGKPVLAVTDIPVGKVYNTVVMATMCLAYKSGLKEALEEIRRVNPQARFAGVPFTSSRMILVDKVYELYIWKSACDHVAGVIGQEQSCKFILNSKGRKLFYDNLKQGLGLVLQFQYFISGVVRNGAGGFNDLTTDFSVAAKIMAKDLSDARALPSPLAFLH